MPAAEQGAWRETLPVQHRAIFGPIVAENHRTLMVFTNLNEIKVCPGHRSLEQPKQLQYNSRGGCWNRGAITPNVLIRC